MNDYTFTSDAVTSVFDKIWKLSPYLHEPNSYNSLKDLTQQLIKIYNVGGRLEEHPFQSTTTRKLSLPVNEIKQLIKTSTCIVTGGLGCVGSCLVSKLLEFEAGTIVIIDKQADTKEQIIGNSHVVTIQADICCSDVLNHIFEQYQPEFVFHTAAQRDPGYAEKHVLSTVQTNVIGTLNVANACEKTGSVQQCVYSSTGKASRYYTTEVYAATKKLGEYIFDMHAAQSSVRYSMVRFTHVLDNSLMNLELQAASKNNNHIAIHSPGKYVTAQNVTEAADLLLNALLNSEIGQCKFLTVRNLEWPVESLEVALYYINQANNAIPVIFKGNPPGYVESFFRGQFDWSNPQELNLLINVYDCKTKTFNQEGDIIISQISSTNPDVLQNALLNIKNVKDEITARYCLSKELKSVVKSALNKVDKNDTLNILKWGLQELSENNEAQQVTAEYEPMVSMLKESLKDAISYRPINGLFNQVKGSCESLLYYSNYATAR